MVFIGTALNLKQFIRRQAKLGITVTERAGSQHLGRGVWAFQLQIGEQKEVVLDKPEKTC